MDKRLGLLFDFQDFESNAKLKAVIDAVHARYSARKLSDDEVDCVAAAGMPEKPTQRIDPDDVWK